MMNLRWAIFASGRGSNFRNFLELEGQLKHQTIVCFHSDKSCPAGLLAKDHAKPALILSPTQPDHEKQLLNFLQEHQVNAIFLMGYMRLLKPSFLSQWQGALVNLHPSRLPEFKGKNAIQKAYEAKAEILGVSLHRVVEEVDSGEILRQRVFCRDFGLDLAALEARFHQEEHELVREFVFDLDRDESFRLALRGS